MTDGDSEQFEVAEAKGVTASRNETPPTPERPARCTISDDCHRAPDYIIRYTVTDRKGMHAVKRWGCEACFDAIRLGRMVTEGLSRKRS